MAQDDDDRLKARPYLITAGKTRSDLPLVAMVVARRAPGADLRHERRAVVEQAANPVALVEISARLGLPLGVVRVLAGELADEGWIDIHTAATTADSLDLDTLLRVIDAVKLL